MKSTADIFPVRTWQTTDASALGWSAAGLKNLAETLAAHGGRSTAMMVVDGGSVVFEWGDVQRPSSVASVRKSLTNVLFGTAVAEGHVALDQTLAMLGIDDIEPLTELERSATVGDLLKARSGVYHPAVYDTPNGRPGRGVHAPGTFWFYNNWDFNALGTIFERSTGHSLFDAFASRIATPLGLQDIAPGDGRYLHGPQSCHPVYKMRLSARDLARIGLLYLRNGVWDGQQVVSASWVEESTRAHTDLGGGRGYGYLWWTAEADAPGDPLATRAALIYASGFGGQYVILIPSLDLVVVHRAADVDHGISHARMGELLRLLLRALPERRASGAQQ